MDGSLVLSIPAWPWGHPAHRFFAARSSPAAVPIDKYRRGSNADIFTRSIGVAKKDASLGVYVRPYQGETELMRSPVSKPRSIMSDRAQIDALVLQIGRLVRHRGYVRTNVASAMLLKYLPSDAGYDWRGEAGLQVRFHEAGLDLKTLEYLLTSARLEITHIQERAR
ncbi:hypothetical protein MKK68_22145 [Methylobacterium sp. E-016]|uniref:hypothetical protein n=1 Tax=Methylobacterium sp. E-016 TaxID=2836556 RepID=UPI001FB94CF5|nr:hypothetical protein [Methylobacterium sp. E-016]MCJ2078314.1 hypothetical protein [Methylobacterium sp. E-016]